MSRLSWSTKSLPLTSLCEHLAWTLKWCLWLTTGLMPEKRQEKTSQRYSNLSKISIKYVSWGQTTCNPNHILPTPKCYFHHWETARQQSSDHWSSNKLLSLHHHSCRQLLFPFGHLNEWHFCELSYGGQGVDLTSIQWRFDISAQRWGGAWLLNHVLIYLLDLRIKQKKIFQGNRRWWKERSKSFEGHGGT